MCAFTKMKNVLVIDQHTELINKLFQFPKCSDCNLRFKTNKDKLKSNARATEGHHVHLRDFAPLM